MGFISDAFDSYVDFLTTILEYFTRLAFWWFGALLGVYSALWAAGWRIPTDLWHTFTHILSVLKRNSPWALHEPSRYALTNGPTKIGASPPLKKKPAVSPEYNVPVRSANLIPAKVA